MTSRKTILKVGGSLLLLGALLFFANIDRVAQTILRMDPLLFIAAFSIVIPTTMFKTLRWKYLMDAAQVRIPFGEMTKIFMIGFFFSEITPSKIGTAMKFHYLKKYYGISTGVGISLSVIDRVFDAILLVVLAFLSLFLFFASDFSFFGSLLFIPLVAGLIGLTFNERVFKAASRFGLRRIGPFKRLLRVDGEIDVEEASERFYTPFRTAKTPKTFFIVFLLSVLVWVSIGFQLSLTLLAMGYPVDTYSATVLSGAGSFIALLPISFAGLGVREGSLALFLNALSVPLDAGISATVILFLIGHLPPVIVGWFIYLASKRPARPAEQRPTAGNGSVGGRTGGEETKRALGRHL